MQMNQPWGAKGGSIDSAEMLREKQPVIGTGEWDDTQCRYFKDEDPHGRGLKNGDLVLVHEGKTPIALCEVTSPAFKDAALTQGYHHENFRNVKVLEWIDANDEFPQVRGTIERLTNIDTESYDYIKYYHDRFKASIMLKELESLLRLKGKGQLIFQGPPGTGKTYTAQDLAHYLIEGAALSKMPGEREKELKKLGQSGQYYFVQFHPAYTYEDFVRGISADVNEGAVSYTVEDRLLADVARRAAENLELSQRPETENVRQQQVRGWLGQFKQYLETTLSPENVVMLTEGVKVNRITPDAIRYTGINGWRYDGGVPDRDVVEMYMRGMETRDVIKTAEGLTPSARTASTYWLSVLQKFREYLVTQGVDQSAPADIPIEPRKNYVLVIDEINRANLPSVLGELIFALEYRGSNVDSIYDHPDYGRKIQIPENLFIIGTMNTADRSVGTLDYAIRRRFCFVPVLPTSEAINLQEGKQLFDKVKALFTSDGVGYLSSDFSSVDVQIGQSYFLADSTEQLRLKLQYEIKPILREYIRDGILNNAATAVVEALNV